MSEKVNRIFSSVAEKYDLVNSLFSMGLIIVWRRSGADKAMIPRKRYSLLDIGTGTGDLAFEIYKRGREEGKQIRIIAFDYSNEMLDVARRKGMERNMDIRFEKGDAMKMKYADNSFDVVTSSFVLRNVDDLNRFAREARRVLKRGGRFVFMDMGRADNWFNRFLIDFYWTAIGIVGLLVDREAYAWLVNSTNGFDRHEFALILEKAGFRDVRLGSLPSGAAFIVTGRK